MNDRGMIKWQPFSAVVPSEKMLKDVLDEKCKIRKPILSEDQEKDLEIRILDSFNEKEIVTIMYYKEGKLYKITGIITNIDVISRKILINTRFSLFFSQIIKFL